MVQRKESPILKEIFTNIIKLLLNLVLADMRNY